MNTPLKTKIGILGFDYKNFNQFQTRVASDGFFTSNLGDNIQTIASRLLLKSIGVNESDIITINRDSISSYKGAPVNLVTNGVLFKWFFPLPANIRPIFIGVCVAEYIIKDNVDYFIQHQPVGCRDAYTDSLFKKHGVMSYISGCVTLTLPKREKKPENGKVIIVYGDKAGAFPSRALQEIPREYLSRIEFKYQRCPHFNAPLSDQQVIHNERYAEHLLNYYKENADLIITPLHHAAAPCIAMNIPTILCREKRDERFSFLETITDIYYPDSFHAINWSARPIDIEIIKSNFTKLLKEKIFHQDELGRIK